MKLKLDENLGSQCIELFQAAGHDVATVAGQGMTSSEDRVLLETCTAENRALVTLDMDFSNPLAFPPERTAGIAVLRLPHRASHATLVALVETLIDALRREELSRNLWSVEAGRIRIYQPPPSDDASSHPAAGG